MMSEKEQMSVIHRLYQIFQDRLESYLYNDEILATYITHIEKGELNLLNSFCIERGYNIAIKPDMFRLQLEFSHDMEDLK